MNNELVEKAKRVIMSCTTSDQLKSAKNFAGFVVERMDSSTKIPVLAELNYYLGWVGHKCNELDKLKEES